MKRMSKHGVKVMRTAAIIFSCVIVVCLIASVVLAYYFDWNPWLIGLVIVIAVLLLVQLVINVWLMPIYKYRVFRYQCEHDLVTVKTGFIFIKQIRIPMYRIQNVDIREGWLMRKYHLASLVLSTAGGNTDIKLVEKKVARSMMKFIKQQYDVKPMSSDEEYN